MNCPFCDSNQVKTLETRYVQEAEWKYRRKQCLSCSLRFSTYEFYDDHARNRVDLTRLHLQHIGTLKKQLKKLRVKPGESQ